MYFKVSLDEWGVLKPDEAQRAMAVLKDMHDIFRTSGGCNNCTKWMIEVKRKW